MENTVVAPSETAAAPPRRKRDIGRSLGLAGAGRLRVFLGWVAIMVAVVFYFAFNHVPGLTDTGYLLGMLGLALCTFPLAIWVTRRERRIPIFEVVCLAFAAQYVQPALASANAVQTDYSADPIQMPASDLAGALGVIDLGLFLMIATYYILRFFMHRGEAGDGSKQELPSDILWLACLLSAVLYLLTSNTPLHSISFLGRFSEMVGLWALGGMALGVYSGLFRERYQRWIAYGYAGILTAYGLASGMAESAATPIAIVVLCMWVGRGRFPWRYFLIGAIALYLVNGTKSEYRLLVWGSDTPISTLDKIGVWKDLIWDDMSSILSGNSTTLASNNNSMTTRLDFVHLFERVYELTPSHVPYAGALPYTYAIYGWIPRFVWPDKPVGGTSNNALAVQYGVLSPQVASTGTSIGMGFIGEAWAAAGLQGVLIVMVFLGFFLALLRNRLASSAVGVQAISASIAVPFLNGIGSNLPLIAFGVIQSVVVTYTLILVLRRWEARGGLSGARRQGLPGNRTRAIGQRSAGTRVVRTGPFVPPARAARREAAQRRVG